VTDSESPLRRRDRTRKGSYANLICQETLSALEAGGLPDTNRHAMGAPSRGVVPIRGNAGQR
jgi:hypothetical protein